MVRVQRQSDYFRIRISGPAEDKSWKLARVHVEYDYSKDDDARSV